MVFTRLKEIRVVNLYIAKLNRQILVLRKAEPQMATLMQEKEELVRLLLQKESEAVSLSKDLGEPRGCHL
jgi:hypothetical protein